MTHLDGEQIHDLTEALLDAYPSEAELAMMVRYKLNQRLAAIAMGNNLRVVAFNLVTWAEHHGCADELVRGAIKQTPGNPALQAYLRCWLPAAAPAPSPPASPPTGPATIDIFLSYSRHNWAAMRTVEAGLRSAGLSVWTDEGLTAGTPSWTASIEEAVKQASAMVVLLSPAAKASPWVEREVALADELGKHIYPILIEGDVCSAVPLRLINVQRVDGRQELGEAVGRVVAQMGLQPVPPPTKTAPPPAPGPQAEEVHPEKRRAMLVILGLIGIVFVVVLQQFQMRKC